jgi:hypothetical protein
LPYIFFWIKIEFDQKKGSFPKKIDFLKCKGRTLGVIVRKVLNFKNTETKTKNKKRMSQSLGYNRIIEFNSYALRNGHDWLVV